MLNSKLEAAFWEAHEEHPEVYRLLVIQAHLFKAAGMVHSTIKHCYEAVRSHCDVYLNNNYTAFYARLIMEREPELKGFFRLRRQKVQSSLGPDNSSLESGAHQY